MVQHDTQEFEKYGFKFRIGVVTETRPKWEKVYRSPTGEVLSQEELKALADEMGPNSDKRIGVDWEQVDGTVDCKYVGFADITDPESPDVPARSIQLYATSDGPIMAIEEDYTTGEEYCLLDPCVVQYDGKGKIKLLPIFNVARRLILPTASVRNVQTPSEMLVALYPGFLIQNRMFQYQLRPTVPFAESPELDNLADA